MNTSIRTCSELKLCSRQTYPWTGESFVIDFTTPLSLTHILNHPTPISLADMYPSHPHPRLHFSYRNQHRQRPFIHRIANIFLPFFFVASQRNPFFVRWPKDNEQTDRRKKKKPRHGPTQNTFGRTHGLVY